MRGWVGTVSGLDVVEKRKICPADTQTSIHRLSIPSLAAVPIELSWLLSRQKAPEMCQQVRIILRSFPKWHKINA
jgi:hypothetical protein